MSMWEKSSRNMNVWYDSGWVEGSWTYSSMLKVMTCLKLWGMCGVGLCRRGVEEGGGGCGWLWVVDGVIEDR